MFFHIASYICTEDNTRYTLAFHVVRKQGTCHTYYLLGYSGI